MSLQLPNGSEVLAFHTIENKQYAVCYIPNPYQAKFVVANPTCRAWPHGDKIMRWVAVPMDLGLKIKRNGLLMTVKVTGQLRGSYKKRA